MTENNKRFYCKKDGNNQWTVSDRLNQYPMPITSLEFCSVVANALNGLWEKTVRFEKYNQDYMKENEQLKKENYELYKRLGDFEPFERYIKERTSKTSVNDIIGFVKTDEQTNSVELKKELYK